MFPCSLLTMGEGMLVGSFARALFLVHSECAESRYIASRPFRVNAGPVSFLFKAFPIHKPSDRSGLGCLKHGGLSCTAAGMLATSRGNVMQLHCPS